MPILKPIKAIQLNKSHPLSRGLVGCWLFNEGTGNKVFDLSGNGNIGILVADTHFVPGKFGSALDFDGTGDYVNCGNKNSLNTTSAFTVLVWIYPKSDVRGGVIARSDTYVTKESFDIFVYPTKRIYFRLGDGVDHITLSASVLELNKWQSIVATYNGSSAKLYKNTTEVSSATISNIITSNLPVMIGKEGDLSDCFDGLIEHAMIFNRALSASEVAQLYREPFCIFDVSTKLGLLYPVGQIVWLTAVSTATASAHGSLTRHRKLAGIVSSAATLSGILKLRYRGQVERQWLIEALFDGMTSNAFKLGTVLTGGWFWMRRTGCSALYRGPSMEQIDFANILTVAEQDADSISPPSHIPHHSSSTYFYVVRRFNNCGYQERTLAAAVKVSIDTQGNLSKPQPNNIFTWRVDQVDGNKTELTWFYCPLEQKSRPAHFKIYYDGGTGLIDYQNPIATINYQGRKFYTYQSDALPAGRYLFAVRAEDADSIENNSLAQLQIQLNITNPDVIEVLSVETL